MKSKRNYYREIGEYYRESNWLYKHVWYRGKSLGLHFGFADEHTKNHNEALINQYRYVEAKGKIGRGMKVLDAGCGVGGASLYLAKQTGVHCTGVSIVPEQIAEAKKNAKEMGVAGQTRFLIADYLDTGLPAASFEVAFGIESVCYAMSKKAFVREAWRVLKPGGMIVITDGYRKREGEGIIEKQIMTNFCRGWRLADLGLIDEMTKAMKQRGFINIEVEEKTRETQMSIERMRRLVKWWKIAEQIIGWINLPSVRMARDNAAAMEAWIDGVERGLFGYFAHVTTKPR